MKIIFGGQLQNAFLTALTKQNNPERWLPAKGGYYGSLHRYQEKSVYDRAGTLAAIASEIIIDEFVDWGLQNDTSHPIKDIADFDARRADRTDYDTSAVFDFAKRVIESGILGPRLCEMLQSGGSEIDDFYKASADEKDNFAIQQLGHIIHSSISAFDTDSYLALTEDDVEILRLVSGFIISENINISFSFPDLTQLNIADDGLLPSALINFSPIDATSILEARRDKLVKRYGASVGHAILSRDDDDRKKLLVEAMREAAEQESRIISSKTVINLFSGIFSMIGVPIVRAVLGQVSSQLEREREKRSFHLLRVRMTEITVREYLKRSDNIS